MQAYITQIHPSKAFIDKLTRLNYNITHLPQLKLTQVIDLNQKLILEHDNIIITSQNAVNDSNAIYFYKKNIFCVGKVTANYLKNLGLENIILQASNASLLSQEIIKFSHIHNVRKFLYLRGTYINFRFKEILSEHHIKIDEIITYHTDKISYDNFPNFFTGDIAVILSNNTATAFINNLVENNINPQFLTCFVFSEDIKNILQQLKFKNIIVTQPNLCDMYNDINNS